MSLDIEGILTGWNYKPGQVSVRKILGRDGREKIQLRLDMGLLQMETAGRPDGARPYGSESLLAHQQRRLKRHVQQHGSDDAFGLDGRTCELLRAEGTMHYHRYLAEYVLEEYEAVERDAMRNIRLFDFCNRYARDMADRFALEQYRPYVIMMLARARAMLALRRKRPKSGLNEIDKGIEQLLDFSRLHKEAGISVANELAVLKSMKKEIRRQAPADPRQQLRKALDKAIHDERYEDAAALRDQLRNYPDRRR